MTIQPTGSGFGRRVSGVNFTAPKNTGLKSRRRCRCSSVRLGVRALTCSNLNSGAAYTQADWETIKTQTALSQWVGKIPNPKTQIPNKFQFPKLQIPMGVGPDWNLELGVCLGFGIWDLDFGISIRVPPHRGTSRPPRVSRKSLPRQWTVLPRNDAAQRPH